MRFALACPAHRTAMVHDFTSGQVERIVYTLLGMEADERGHAELPDPAPEAVCLLDVLDLSHSGEGFHEWTEQLLTQKRGSTT